MQLRFTKHGSETRKQTETAEKANTRLGAFGLSAAVAAAAIMISTPLCERRAYAQEAQMPVPIAAEESPKAEEPASPTEAAPRNSTVDVDVGTIEMRFDTEKPSDVPISSTPPKPDYRDPALGGIEKVDMNGNERPISLNHKVSGGGGILSNEAGSAVSAFMAYNFSRNNMLRFDGGNIWFGALSAPFATMSVKESLDLGHFTGMYYGRVSAVGYLPSYLYTSHAIGVGYSQPFGADNKWRLRLGAFGIGAFSYPLGDDSYLNIAGGASLEYNKRILVYGAPNFYFAASTPIRTAYIGYYAPQLESVSMGAQFRFSNYSIGPFANYGVIKSMYGGSISRTMNFGDWATGDVFVRGGITHWNPDINPGNDVMIIAGLNLVIAGPRMNTVISSQYERMGPGGVPQATTDIPTTQNPGPYGFGRSGDANWDTVDNNAKSRLLGAKSFDDFTAKYKGASTDDVINAGRFLLAFMQQVAYAQGAQSALMAGNFLDPSVIKVASVDNNQLLAYLQGAATWYSTHNTPYPQPGVTLCAGAADFVGDFYRANGIHTVVATANTRGGMHVVDIAYVPGKTNLLSWGDMWSGPANQFDPMLRLFGQYNKAPTFESQLFTGPTGSSSPNTYKGTYVTPEGNLLHGEIGIPGPWLLNREFLGVR